MARNLHPLIRYRAIDDCLKRTSQKWSTKDIIEACGNRLREMISSDIPNPSRRQFFVDLDNMKNGKLGYEAPIVYDTSKKSYVYTDPKFSITNTPLNSEDIEELNYALNILKQFSGFSSMPGVENIVAKLEHRLQTNTKTKEILHIDQYPSKESLQWLETIFENIKKEQRLQFTYVPFGQEAILVDASPLLLKEYNNRWFLFGYSHELEDVKIYGLDRIKELKSLDTAYFYPASFNSTTYFKNIIGVSIGDGIIQRVVLLSTPYQFNYIKTKPIHHSQKIIEERDDGVIFSLEIILNYELESRILSFGEHVEVLEPEFFRLRMAERIGNAGRKYINP